MKKVNNVFENISHYWEGTKNQVIKELKDFFAKNPGKIIELYYYIHHYNAQVQYIGIDSEDLWFKQYLNNDSVNFRPEHIDPVLLAKISSELSKGKYNIIVIPEEGEERVCAGRNKNDDPIYVSIRLTDYPDDEECKEMRYELCSLIKQHGLKSSGPRAKTYRFTYKLEEPIKVRYMSSRHDYNEEEINELTVTTKRGCMAMNTMTMYSHVTGGVSYFDNISINSEDFKKLIETVYHREKE